MKFLMDHNVSAGVTRLLRELGHDVVTVQEVLYPEAEDQIVATAAVQEERVLVSHDADMKRIERKISEAHRDRFPALCRLMLCCPEAAAVERIRLFIAIIEFEFEQAAAANSPMMFELGARRVRIHR